MCGRFTLFTDEQELIDEFAIENSFTYEQSFNIAPSQHVLAIINNGKENRAGQLHWGLIPPWAKDKKIAYKMINARGETLAEKPSFKRAFQSRRCIIPTSGFYEWKRTEDGKKPYFIRLKNQDLFAFAGLWEKWKDPISEEDIYTCTIVTTSPNKMMANLHDRMPLLLDRKNQEDWLNPQMKDKDYLQQLVKPFPSEEMTAYEVSTAVNKPVYNGPELVERLSGNS